MELMERLAARAEIGQCLALYARGVDRLDAALIRSCFHDDCEQDLGSYRGGPDGYAAWVVGHLGGSVEGSMHLIHQVCIEFPPDDDAVAFVESYVEAHHMVASSDADPDLLETLYARYVDRFENRPGAGWRVARRTILLEGQSHQPLVGAAARRPGACGATTRYVRRVLPSDREPTTDRRGSRRP